MPTDVTTRPPELEPAPAPVPTPSGLDDGIGPAAPTHGSTEAVGVNPLTTSLAAGAASAAAAWVVAGLFRDFAAHLVALGGVVIGVGVVVLSYRVPRGGVLRYLTVPLAALVGAILVAPDARGGTSSFASLVTDAIRTGGLLQPPVAFAPGWRFILLVLFALIGGGAASLGVSLGRPKLALVIPVPLLIWASAVQPPSAEIASVAVAFVLLGVAATLAFGAELSSDGQLSAAFELRRLARGGAMAAGLAVMVLVLSQAGFLFPQPKVSHVVPPQKPQPQPVPPDSVLYTYTATREVPLRLGVIDVYDPSQRSWLLPPYDASRLQRIQAPAGIPGVGFHTTQDSVSVTVTVAGAPGHSLPAVAGVGRIDTTHDAVDFDPRTGVLTLADKPLYTGLQYTVVGPAIPTGVDLAKAGPAPHDMAEFLTAPPPPSQITAILTDYSQTAVKLGVPEDGYNRLQFLRQQLYSKVVAAGPGLPAEMTAERVAQMLSGAEASPYEIIAAEALVSRWAGVPSRIGYGYYGGDKQSDGSIAVHPRHAAMWLEAYFEGFGWQPLVGTPPKAKPSIRPDQKNQQNIQAADGLDLAVYIPVREPTITLAFEYVRYYLARILPAVAAVILLLACYPYGLKALRRWRRRQWARAHGGAGRMAVAYANFRDHARDLTVGDPAATPVRFLRYTIGDAEHEELAWLVTRALWGDLRRDLRDEDVAAAEQLARSMTRRLDRAQPMLNRVLARIARTSLRDPYSRQIPNAWRDRRRRATPAGLWRRVVTGMRHLRPARLRGAAAGVAVTLVLPWLLGGCGSTPPPAARPLQTDLVPQALPADGGARLVFTKEADASAIFAKAGSDALISDGVLFTIHLGDTTEGSFQMAVFKPDIDVSDLTDSQTQACTDQPDACQGHEVLAGIQKQIGTGQFHRVYFHSTERAYVMQLPDQRIYLWFRPSSQTMCILTLVAKFGSYSSDMVFRAMTDFQLHASPAPSPIPLPVDVPGPPGSAATDPTVAAVPTPAAAATTPGVTP